MPAKAVPAEGRRNEGPLEHPAHCIAWDGDHGTVELDTEQGGVLEVQQSQLWQWTLAPNLQPKKLTADKVKMGPGDRCVVARSPVNGSVQAVQLIVRFTGKISSRPSSSVGQIEPDEQWRKEAGAKVFLRLSEIAGVHTSNRVVSRARVTLNVAPAMALRLGALQLPDVGERVEFQLALNPERADRLWAAEVTMIEPSVLAMTPPTQRTAASSIAAASPRVTVADADTSTSEPVDRTGGQSPGVRVYVRNVSPNTEWLTLLRVLSTAGEVGHGQLLTDGQGRSRGMAVAHYTSVEAAQQAVHLLNNAELDGQRLSVSLDSRALPAAAAQPIVSAPVQQVTARRGFQPGRRVYVGRLPADVGWRELSELFAGCGELVHVQTPFDIRGRSRGFGIVEFASVESASSAIRKYARYLASLGLAPNLPSTFYGTERHPPFHCLASIRAHILRIMSHRLENAEIRGQKLILRDDTVVVSARPTNRLYVGNLSPAVTWQVYRACVSVKLQWCQDCVRHPKSLRC